MQQDSECCAKEAKECRSSASSDNEASSDATNRSQSETKCCNRKSVLEDEGELVKAVHLADTDKVVELLNNGADPNTVTKGGWSVLHMAAIGDSDEIRSALIEKGANVNATDGKGQTALHYASVWDAPDAIAVLLEAGADVDKESEDQLFYLNGSIPIHLVGGRTALHNAAEKGYFECANLLVSAGAKTDKKDFSGNTPYDLACRHKRLDIANMLRPDVTEHVTNLPYDMAKEQREVKERLKGGAKLLRKQYIERVKKEYQQMHPEVYSLRESYFEPSFLAAIKEGTLEAFKSIMTEVTSGVYVFNMLSEEFRRLLVEELDNFEKSGLPIRRPNSMNNYGVILNEIGFKDTMYDLMDRYISPMAKVLFPDAGGATLDRHHSFVVKYKIGEDLALEEHVDDSEVTLNVSLGREFEGGDLDFHGVQGTPSSKQEHFQWQHKPGVGVLHLGSHWHSALPIHSGERWNLIVWCRSSKKRSLPIKKPKIRTHAT